MTNRAVGGLLLMFSIAGGAQDYRGRVQGMITDPMNAAITLAAVRIESTATMTPQPGAGSCDWGNRFNTAMFKQAAPQRRARIRFSTRG